MNRRHAALWLAGLVLLTTAAYGATTLTAETRGTVPVGASGGPMAGVTADRTDLTDYSINQSAARITTSEGEIVIAGQDGAYATVDQFEGEWSNLSQINYVSPGELRVSPADKQMVIVDGVVRRVAWKSKADTQLDDGEVDLRVGNPGGGSVRIGGLDPNTDIAAIDDDTTPPEVITTTTTTASGHATLSGLDYGGDKEIRLREQPGTLYIRNESDPSQLVGSGQSPVDVEVRFFLGEDTTAPDQIITREVSDGTINMTGLPINESFVVVADADGYYPRRIFVESLLQQETIYLLPESQPSVQKFYQLTDYTGLYPQDRSVVKIQRPINGSWRTVQGDYFGASGEFEAVLREGARHRLVILNTDTGQRRILGRVTPFTSGTQQIEIQSRSDIELQRIGPLPSILPSTRALPAAQTDVTVGVDPLRSELVGWNYTVTLVQPGGTTQQLASDTLTSGGTANPSFNLSGEADASVRVSVGWEAADGREMVTNATFRIVEDYQGYSLLDGLTEFPTLFSSSGDATAATSVIALLLSVFGAGTVGLKLGASTEGIGLVALGLLAVFGIIGWLAYAVVFAAAVAWVALVALRRGL